MMIEYLMVACMVLVFLWVAYGLVSSVRDRMKGTEMVHLICPHCHARVVDVDVEKLMFDELIRLKEIVSKDREREYGALDHN